MIKGDKQLGKPFIEYGDTKTALESLVGVEGGMIAFATDTKQFGFHNNTSWLWTTSTPTASAIPLSDAAGHLNSWIVAATPTTLAIDSINTEGVSEYFARADHIHAIATSNNPGASASILASSTAGHLTLVQLNTDTISDRSGGNLSIAPTGDVELNPIGAQVRVMASHTLQSDNYASQTTGWGISYAGGADFRYLFADEMHVKSFIADLEQALAGGQIISKSVAVVAEDFNVPGPSFTITGASSVHRRFYVSQDPSAYLTVGCTIEVHDGEPLGATDYNGIYTVSSLGSTYIVVNEPVLSGRGGYITKDERPVLTVEDLPGASGQAVFEEGDVIGLRQFSRSAGSLSVSDCWGTVISYSDNGDGTQDWTFLRSYSYPGAATAGTTIEKGTLALDYGVSGNGFYEVSAVDGAWGENSPYAQVVTWDSHPASGQTVRVRLGNLYGITSTTEYGLYAGEGVSAGDSYLRLTDQNFELHNLDLAMYDSANTQRIGMDAGAESTEKLMWAGESESNPGFVVYGNGDVWLSTLAVSDALGQSLFSAADGLLLLGPGCAITPTSWTSTRGQVATISGAFHQVQGPWDNSKALVIEPGATNLCANPRPDPSGSLTGWSSWSADGTNVTASGVDSSFPGVGNISLRFRFQNVTGIAYFFYRNISVTSGSSYTLSFFAKSTTAKTMSIRLQEASGSYSYLSSAVTVSLTTEWQWLTVTMLATGTCATSRVNFAVSTPPSDYSVYMGNVVLTAAAYGTTYIDGGLGTGYTWNGDGTPHANTSTRAATVVNLNAYAGILSDLDTVTHSVWVQAPYDADADWACGSGRARIIDYRGADDANRLVIAFYPDSSDSLYVYANGRTIISATNQTFKAGDWLHVLLTMDYGNDSYHLYLNGELIGSSSTPLTAPTGVVDWTLGVDRSGAANWGGWAFGEYAVFGRVLTAEEVAGLYARGKPLADAGALKRPGIYVMDGEVDIRTSQTGARVQIDADGIAAHSDTTTQTIHIQTDGDLFAGSDISDPATTALAVFATAQTYNSESMGAGDVLLGDNSAGKINLLWDVSEGDVILRRGTSQRIKLDGSLDVITIGDTSNSYLAMSSSEIRFFLPGTTDALRIDGTSIKLYDGSVKRVEITSAGVMTINDSGGNAVFTFNASAGAEFTRPLSIATTGGIYQGSSGSFDSPGTGLKIWNDGGVGRIAGYNSTNIQWYANTDGKLYAGGGNVWLDQNGVQLIGGNNDYNKIRWTHPTYVTRNEAAIHNYISSSISYLVLDALGGTDNWGWVWFRTGYGGTTSAETYFGPYKAVFGYFYSTPYNYPVCISDSVGSGFLSAGLVINQLGNDNEILCLKSTDIAHGITTYADTNTFGAFAKYNGDTGGLQMTGYSEDKIGVTLVGRSTNDDTAKSTSGIGYISLDAQKKSGTGVTSPGTDANLVVIRSHATTRFIFDAEGSGHSDVEWRTFDTHDDLALLDRLEQTVMAKHFGGWVDENRAELERLGIAHFDDRPGHAMVNWTRLSMLLTGAIRQMGARLTQLEQDSLELQSRFLASN